MSNKEFIKELRCLRMHLSPVLTAEKLNVLLEAERRLTSSGAVSTVPVPSKVTKKSQGKRLTKKEIYNKYFYK